MSAMVIKKEHIDFHLINYYLIYLMMYTAHFYKLFISKVKKERYLMRQDYTILCHFYQAVVAIYISILLICFCSFDLSCPILKKDSFIEHLYIVLSCLIK